MTPSLFPEYSSTPAGTPAGGARCAVCGSAEHRTRRCPHGQAPTLTFQTNQENQP